MHFEENKEYRVKQVIVPLGIVLDLVEMVPGMGFGCVENDLPEDFERSMPMIDVQSGVMRIFYLSDTFDPVEFSDVHKIPILKGATMRMAKLNLPKKQAEPESVPKIVEP